MIPEFRVTDRTHEDCDKCLAHAEHARIMARVTGSTGSTSQDTHRDDEGAVVVDHSATVSRLDL